MPYNSEGIETREGIRSMEILIGTALVFGSMVLAMSVGVLISGRSLKGSCGGISGSCPCTEAERRTCSRRK